MFANEAYKIVGFLIRRYTFTAKFCSPQLDFEEMLKQGPEGDQPWFTDNTTI